MATVEEIETLISKLLSDKAKLREEGVKALLSYLDASGGASLCPLLDCQTALFGQPDKLLSSTWPGIVRAVCHCNKLEYAARKKKPPKPIFSKALRTVVQKAEDRIRAGACLFLPQDVKNLFSHLLEAMAEVPSFFADYSHIVRQLVMVPDFCSHMSRNTYAKLVGFLIERVKSLVHENATNAALSKEEAFRMATTLYSLLQNTPDDFLEKVRVPLVEGLGDIFLHLRDEGRVARKLVASLNVYLLKHGVNLGDLLLDIHSNVKGFILRTWKVTRDRELKDELVLYGKLQLRFRTVVELAESDFIPQMRNLVEKDLDQACAVTFTAGSYRFDGGREGKVWTITKGMQRFLDFAASILCEASSSAGTGSLAPSKKQKQDDIFAIITERLIKGNALWWGSFCLLVRNYHRRIHGLLLYNWLKTLGGHLESMFTDASGSSASFEALVWTLRCLQELSAVWHSHFSSVKWEKISSPGLDNECENIWDSVWVTVMHWLSFFSGTSIIVDESSKLLGYLLVQNLVPVYSVPQDFWSLKPFTETPSGNMLFFVASFFSSSTEQVTVREDFQLWKKLLNWTLLSVDKQEHLQLRIAAVLALTVGYVPYSLQRSTEARCTCPVVCELDDWAKLEEYSWNEEGYTDAFNELACFLPEVDQDDYQGSTDEESGASVVSFPIKHVFVKELADTIVQKAGALCEGNHEGTLEQYFTFSSFILACIKGVVHALHRRGQESQEWASEGQVYQGLSRILSKCTDKIEDCICKVSKLKTNPANAPVEQSSSEIFTVETRKSLKVLLSMERCHTMLDTDDTGVLMKYSCVIESILANIVRLMQLCSDLLGTNRDSQSNLSGSSPSTFDVGLSDDGLDATILDADFDDAKKLRVSDPGGGEVAVTNTSLRENLSSKQRWKLSSVSMIEPFAQYLPDKTVEVLLDLLRAEHDPKIEREILLCLCRSVRHSKSNEVSYLVDYIEAQKDSAGWIEGSPYFVLTALDTLLTTLSDSKKGDSVSSLADIERVRTKWNIPKEVFVQVSKLLDDVSQNKFPVWHSRGELAEAVAKLFVLDPSVTDALLDTFLSFLHDVDYRVRFIMSRKVEILFHAYTGHEEVFHDICAGFGIKMVMAVQGHIVTATEVSLNSENRCFAETAIMTLGKVAACSEKVEVEAVFMICANAAIFPFLRSLACVTLDRLAKQLHYPNRWKYLSHMLSCIFSYWVKVGLPLPSLVEIRELLVCNSEPVDFLKYCCSLLLPSLLLHNCDNELTWLAKVLSKPVSILVKDSSAAIFASLLPLFSHGSETERTLAVSVLQGKMLVLANLTEDDRDHLIKKNVVTIVNSLFQLCSDADSPRFPFHSKEAIFSSVRMVVDGFCGSESSTCQVEGNDQGGMKDVLKIFRADRVFMFILQIHLQIEASFNSRHRRAKLAGLACLINVIKETVKVPSTLRYLFHTILQSLEMVDLHEECCRLLRDILYILSSLPSDEFSQVLGPQLQLIVPHLVSTCMKIHRENDEMSIADSHVFAVLNQVTVFAATPLHQYIKELPPFPNLPVFKSICAFHSSLQETTNIAPDFGKFVVQTARMPSSLQLKSLQNLHTALSNTSDGSLSTTRCFHLQSDSRAALELLRSVRHCFGSKLSDVINVVGDFIAKMGVGDPHAVVFGLYGHDTESSSVHTPGHMQCVGTGISPDVPEEVVRMILLQLKNYLLDEHALVIELTTQTLKGMLSTEKGWKVLKNMELRESAYLSVFSKGLSPKIVEDSLNMMRIESNKRSLPLENDALWNMSGKSYDEWVCSLVFSLIHYCEDTILRLCQGLVHCKCVLAEALLPHVLGSLAACNGPNSNICKLISCQVEKHIFSEENQNTRSIQLFLDALNQLRHSDILAWMKLGQDHAENQKNSKVYWLDLDYLQTAKVAQKCGAYFTSVLYIEQWCEEKFGSLSLGEPDFSDEEELPLHMELLLNVYTRINEPDGVYGVVRSPKLMPQVLLYEHEGNWSKSVGSYDLLLRNRDVKRPRTIASADVEEGQSAKRVAPVGNIASDWKHNKGLMRSLQRTGCDHVLKVYSKGLAMGKESVERDIEFQELQYESAWRAGTWDFYNVLPKSEHDNALEIPRSANFNSNLYWCLRSLHAGDAELFSCRMRLAKQELVKLISLTSLESTGNVFPSIIRLQMLDTLRKAWGLRWRNEGGKKHHRNKLQRPSIPSTEQLLFVDEDWQTRLIQMQHQFDVFEPFVAFQTVLHKVLGREDHVPRQLLDFATFARKAGCLNQAAAAIYELKQHYKQNTDCANNLEKPAMLAARKVQEAKVLWAQDQHEMAVNLLKYVINHHDLDENATSVYCLTGKWLAETRSESAKVILIHYLQRAVQLLDKVLDKSALDFVKKKSRAHYRMGYYADSLYKSYEERLNSSEWQAALRLRTHKSKEAEVLGKRIQQAEKRDSVKKGAQGSNRLQGQDYARRFFELQRQLAMDNEEALRLESDKDAFLRIALTSYRQCLITNDKYDLRVVFRMTNLWFNLATNQAVIKAMLDTINQVRSYKFLPLVYQIASRLGPLKETEGALSFQHALTCLVRKMAIEHPYHAVYQLLALANGDRIKEKQKSKTAFVIDYDKKQAAEALLHGLALEKRDLIQQMRQLVEIYIRLAEIEVKKEDMNKKLPVPRDIRSIRQLELVPVITADIPVSPEAKYPEGSFPYYRGLSDGFQVMHGVNAPKVVECYGSDGHRYRQLAKSGDDDLRQDAVMEQLFSLVNTLLQHHPDTRKRRLRIRTYKVVPFTPSAGVLEWVTGTMPLGEYLLGSNRKGGAHARYGLGDWTFPACREHLEEEEDKQAAFQRVCENFRPVFHNFFLENFSHPAEWFEKRLAYTRSVAASSMVGYIVGLGDRHSQNILLDHQTAEVVHIDLGVAFEQGKMLKMPERVPFRLTRDIVDGMGVTGVEGVFRRCCEETLLVMRTNKDALLTIIEVFLHDPLYKWALSPLKALQKQQDTIELDIAELESSGENKDAARALLRVKQKLDGYEGGDMRSIQGQVQQLIQDAQDPDKLCRMFPGWAAWL